MFCSCTGIHQIWEIQIEIWPEPNSAGFPKNGGIPDLSELELKSGTTLFKFKFTTLKLTVQDYRTCRHSIYKTRKHSNEWNLCQGCSHMPGVGGYPTLGFPVEAFRLQYVTRNSEISHVS